MENKQTKLAVDFSASVVDPFAAVGYVLQQTIKRKTKALVDGDVPGAIDLINRRGFTTKRKVYEFIDERVDAITSNKRLEKIASMSKVEEIINELKR